ncbi:MAG: hypothetical protein COB85_03235 [Bacteroidetes bacterium]|nr:MAG: hypothetical protein COB85_03235 [Bacteroidota bacterium]
MKPIPKSILILSIVLFPLITNAQVIVYKTYEDFQNKIGEKYDDYKSGGYKRIVLMKDGKKVRLDMKSMWGFTYEDALFRIHAPYGQCVRVLALGKVCYYENGMAHLSMIKNKSKSGESLGGWHCYISKTISSELRPFPYTMVAKSRRDLNAFKAANSEYDRLFECIEKDYSYLNVRPCVDKFNAEEE